MPIKKASCPEAFFPYLRKSCMKCNFLHGKSCKSGDFFEDKGIGAGERGPLIEATQRGGWGGPKGSFLDP